MKTEWTFSMTLTREVYMVSLLGSNFTHATIYVLRHANSQKTTTTTTTITTPTTL